MTSTSAVHEAEGARRDSARATAGSAFDPPRWPLLVVTVALSAFSVWLISPRFAIDGPSLVDDWAAISRSPDQLADLARLRNPEPERFRPSWIAWNYLQWHTFDGPRGLVGPNVWNVGRLLVFVVGMTLMTALMLPRARSVRGSAIHAGVAAIPAFGVLTVPKFARDFAWFGPQEPLLLGGLALGGSLLALTARALLAEAPVKRWSVALMGLAGAFFWLVGVYQKEASLCAIPVLAAALFAGRAHLTHWSRISSTRRAVLAALAIVVALPLLHVAIEAAVITLRGDIVYGAEVDGGAGIAHGLQVLYDWWHEAMPLNARYLVFGAVALVVVAALVRRRVDVLSLAALASGALAIVFAAQSGVAVSRYYIPTYALFLVAVSLSLARFPELVQLAGVLLLFFAFMPPTETRGEVRQWSNEEQQHARIVAVVSDLDRSGCIVATQALDLETSLALPVLVGLRASTGDVACATGAAYLLLPPYPDESLSLVRACAAGRLQPIALGRLLGVYECSQLRSQPVRDVQLGLVEPKELLASLRFRAPATS